MKRFILAAALAAASASIAQAQTIAVLVGGDTLVHVDAKAKKAMKTVKLSGVGPIIGIDVRPADGQLYGVSADGAIVTIDPMSGKAMPKSRLETMLPAGTKATVDFNPVADRLRIIGANGMNLRANVDDGKVVTDGALKFEPGKDGKLNILAGAYTNSIKGAKATTLYDIDPASGQLFKQAPPNDGVLVPVGALGVFAPMIAFDIAASEEGKNAGWIIANGALYMIDLETGKATQSGALAGVSGSITDMAILP